MANIKQNEPRDDMTSAIRENIYVRVFGNVRTFQGKRSVVAFKVHHHRKSVVRSQRSVVKEAEDVTSGRSLARWCRCRLR